MDYKNFTHINHASSDSRISKSHLKVVEKNAYSKYFLKTTQSLGGVKKKKFFK